MNFSWWLDFILYKFVFVITFWNKLKDLTRSTKRVNLIKMKKMTIKMIRKVNFKQIKLKINFKVQYGKKYNKIFPK